MSDNNLITLQQFISQLLARQQRIEPDHVDTALVLADALLLHALVRPSLPGLAAQTVIIGPTQAGKSTIVNVLLGGEFAAASPLAGYTRHAQGFSTKALETPDFAALDSLLPWLRRIDAKDLDADDLGTYSLSRVTPTTALQGVLWDTPDFDSVSSRRYRATVPMLCAIADLIIMVVSREKYADQSVWDILQLLQPTRTATLLCINKVPEQHREQLRGALREKLDHHAMQNIQIITLPYFDHHQENALQQSDAAQTLRDSVRAMLEAGTTAPPREALQQFLGVHWGRWTVGLEAELRARSHWEVSVSSALATAQDFYEAQYLRDAQHSDAMKKALVRLLDLLEIPALAASLGRVRQFITWPTRQLGGLLKRQPNTLNHQDAELSVIQQACQHAWLELRREASEQTELDGEQSQAWWQTLSHLLDKHQKAYEDSLQAHTKQHQKDFAPHIKDAAEHLYAHLQEHPISLNGLRAARASADAAAVVLTVKSGGLNLSDLFLAPAMLAFTSMLTEGALGHYMKTVEDQLRKDQLDSARNAIFDPLQRELIALATELKGARLISLTQDEFEAAKAAREALA